ncbi:hypothetical protein ACFCV3_25295 [Kribbella sp. NPDC056345]|uniref:hypothetical protein n=1 Tax=Kribbella sp. NPDC056345 TaxID=3345789 RepID=UPI0035E27CB4
MAPAEPEPDAEPDPGPAKQSPKSLFWVCAAVTVLIGAFQYSHSLSGTDGLDALAVLGLIVMTLLVLILAGIYALCALERTDLHHRLYGRLDLFQAMTILFVAAVLVGVLIPPRTTTTLGLLLPFGIAYWLYHLTTEKSE